MAIDSKTITNARIVSQKIGLTSNGFVKEVVGHMGAMQAQDFPMSKWAVGVRCIKSTEGDIERSLDSGAILRTHVLRPTWHLVSANDIYWMLELTARQIRVISKSNHKNLELTESVFSKSLGVIVNALEGNKHLTREELMSELNKVGIVTNENRAAHIMMEAELSQLVCSGISIGNKQTYALLEERVPFKNVFTKEESLAKLASTYFSGHGPATLQDFVWWSGLPITDARKALEMAKFKLKSENIDGSTYWFVENGKPIENDRVYLLPAFDEFIIGYKDRTDSLSKENQPKVMTTNGIFRPIIVHNGAVIGTWKRSIKGEEVNLQIELFHEAAPNIKELINKEVDNYGLFLGKRPSLSFN